MPGKAMKLLPMDKRAISPIVIAVIAIVAVVAVVGVVYFLVLAPPTGTLADILSRAEGVTGLQYDLVITTPEGVTTGKVYWEEGKMRTEMTVIGERVIAITREDWGEVYIYYPDRGTIYKMIFTGSELETPLEKSEDVPMDTVEVIGTETVDGEPCMVVEYTAEGATVRAWIWTQYGIALKVRLTSDGKVITTEFKNVVVGDVPDDLFEVPPGIEIIEIPGV